MSSGEPNYKVVATTKAPSAIGPYSQATVSPLGLVFLSGCIPLVPETGVVVEGGIEEQTTQALANLGNVLAEAGTSIKSVVKTTVFIKDMNHFVAMNGVYEKFFHPYKPARSAVEVARLPKDVLVEIECIASVETK